jgi:hypothetical protein
VGDIEEVLTRGRAVDGEGATVRCGDIGTVDVQESKLGHEISW